MVALKLGSRLRGGYELSTTVSNPIQTNRPHLMGKQLAIVGASSKQFACHCSLGLLSKQPHAVLGPATRPILQAICLLQKLNTTKQIFQSAIADSADKYSQQEAQTFSWANFSFDIQLIIHSQKNDKKFDTLFGYSSQV